MIKRSKAKIITDEDYLKTQPKYIVSCDIEDILCKDYVYILDAMDMEDYEYQDSSFNIFKELVFKGKVVGFVSYFEYRDTLCLMEAYVMPEFRGNNIIADEISSVENLIIYNPRIAIVKSLIDSGLAFELTDGIVVSPVAFNVSSFQLVKSHCFDDFYSHVYDLKSGRVLILNKNNFDYSKPNRNDKINFDLVENLDADYLNKAYKIVYDYNKSFLKVTHD